jgi:hypothetical protein
LDNPRAVGFEGPAMREVTITETPRAVARGDVDAPVDSSQVDLATGLYASADRHRRLAERLEAGDNASRREMMP